MSRVTSLSSLSSLSHWSATWHLVQPTPEVAREGLHRAQEARGRHVAEHLDVLEDLFGGQVLLALDGRCTSVDRNARSRAAYRGGAPDGAAPAGDRAGAAAGEGDGDCAAATATEADEHDQGKHPAHVDDSPLRHSRSRPARAPGMGRMCLARRRLRRQHLRQVMAQVADVVLGDEPKRHGGAGADRARRLQRRGSMCATTWARWRLRAVQRVSSSAHGRCW